MPPSTTKHHQPFTNAALKSNGERKRRPDGGGNGRKGPHALDLQEKAGGTGRREHHAEPGAREPRASGRPDVQRLRIGIRLHGHRASILADETLKKKIDRRVPARQIEDGPYRRLHTEPIGNASFSENGKRW